MLFYGTEEPPYPDFSGGNGRNYPKKGSVSGFSTLKGSMANKGGAGEEVSNDLGSESSVEGRGGGWKEQATRRDEVTRTTMDPLASSSSGCISYKQSIHSSTGQCLGLFFFILIASDGSSVFDFLWSFPLILVSFSMLPFKYLINIIFKIVKQRFSQILKNALINQCLGDLNNYYSNKTDLAEILINRCISCKSFSKVRNSSFSYVNMNAILRCSKNRGRQSKT